jgi:hypothetical protein
MNNSNLELHTKLKEAEDELDRLGRRVSIIVCTTVPIAIVTYTALFLFHSCRRIVSDFALGIFTGRTSGFSPSMSDLRLICRM